MLGLDGAGKSTFLSQLLNSEDNCTKPDNGRGSNAVSIQCKNGKTLNFSESKLFLFHKFCDLKKLIYLSKRKYGF